MFGLQERLFVRKGKKGPATPPAAAAERDFFEGSRLHRDGVFAEEFAAIRNQKVDPGKRPDVEHGLVGLALSGGGIRSATFSLGVVQALNEQPGSMFGKVDYLSTVSGGGYLGACISSLFAAGARGGAQAGGQGGDLPFHHTPGKIEHAAFRHLRNYANYLAPGRTGRALRIPALMVQGMLRNLVAVMPAILILAVLVLWLYGGAIKARLGPEPVYFGLREHLPILFGAGLLGVWALIVAPVLEVAGVRLAQWAKGNALLGRMGVLRRLLPDKLTPGRIRDSLLGASTVVLVIFLLCAFVNLQPYAVVLCIDWLSGLSALTALSGTGAVATAMTLARRAAKRLAERFADRMLTIGLALLAPLTLWLLTLLLCALAISPPDMVVNGAFGTDILEPLPAEPDKAVRLATDAFIQGAVGAYLMAAGILFALFVTLYDVNAMSIHAFYRDRLSRAFLFRYDRNEAFAEKESLERNDGVKLSEMAEGRPIHLINAAINIQSSRNRNMRGRNADFFLFSRRFIGCEYTGYRRTPDMEESDPQLDLAAAMAISGAAMAPNAGRQTNRALRFLLTLLNVRLGYWLPNPKCGKSAPPAASIMERLRRVPGKVAKFVLSFAGWRVAKGVSPYYLFLEAFGWLDENRDYVYLTDGGHIDNLGVIELLRRRCRYIVVCDAEADPDMTFEGLAHAIRIARIDLGVDVRLDVTNLRKDAMGLVCAHCALGRIDYGEGQIGHILYIKASVTGDENNYISEYRARHPDFPHETTADQFFDEAQFEAYRALGHHIATGLFETRNAARRLEILDKTPPGYPTVEAWFDSLARWLRPQPGNIAAFLDLQREIAEIDRQLAEPVFAPYTWEIYPESVAFPKASGPDAGPCGGPGAGPAVVVPPRGEVERRVLHLVNDQLHLMERAVLTLNLDDPRNWERASNRGFMNLFRRWSQADLFRLGWAVCISEYSPNLQRFCRDALDLHHSVTWEPVSRNAPFLSPTERKYVARYEGRAETLYAAYLQVGTASDPPNPTVAGFRFIAGLAFVDRQGERAVLRCLRVRNTYRRQRLSQRLARELAAFLSARNLTPYYCLEERGRDRWDRRLAASLRVIFDGAGFQRDKERTPAE